MGKIFDALEKSKVTNKKTHGAVVKAKAEDQAYVNMPVTSSKDMNATDVSYKRVEKVAKLKKQDQTSSFSKNKIPYDFNKMDQNLVYHLKMNSLKCYGQIFCFPLQENHPEPYW
jgi:hypothetical protein